ncbi:MAG: Rossmann-like domain-containing protein [Bacteroidales bacterium]
MIGSKNVAVMLTNGQIGVCSTLGKEINQPAEDILKKPDFTSYEHRILVNAWVNACANYNMSICGNSDIYNAINLSSYSNIVMVGYFKSLIQKLSDSNIKVTVFDLNEEDKPVEPIQNQKESIRNAECIILTATSLANSTYSSILSNVSASSNTFILGPSTPLSPLMFEHLPITGLFGARFKPFDYNVLNSIAQGGGTRSFLDRMEKVWVSNDESKKK